MWGNGLVGVVRLLGGVGRCLGACVVHFYLECLLLGDWLDGEWGRISRTAASRLVFYLDLLWWPALPMQPLLRLPCMMQALITVFLGCDPGNMLT